jgi:hypothetical protein
VRDFCSGAYIVARLVTEIPIPHVLIAGTLAGIHARLPAGLARTGRQPADPPEVVETRFPA